MSSKQRGLGKGLDVIFAENDADDGSSSMEVNINELEPNRNQPRREFNEAELAELADSIAKHGILQPLLVRPLR
ncbi:MAG TPA: stage 0 sporulation protein J, partial [Ruminococcaceae bacterium]|nr:stage 0 sporulation protein J [Oscillospiraceae bacterium]